MVEKIQGITSTSPYHTTTVRYHAWLVILAVLLFLNTAQKQRFTRKYFEKTCVFGQGAAIVIDLDRYEINIKQLKEGRFVSSWRA